MKVLIQWTLSSPQDWAELDLAALQAGEAMKPEPTGRERIDNTPGWVYGLNVQGVLFGGFDHYAVEDRLDGGVTVTVWNDDPEDWAEGERWAEVWTFLPLAPDPDMGGAMNTRQSRVVYAEALAAPQFTGSERTEIRDWGEFTPPPSIVVRHGIAVNNALARKHEEAVSVRGWREWGEGGDVPVQRDMGRYLAPDGTRTWYPTNTDSGIGYGEQSKMMARDAPGVRTSLTVVRDPSTGSRAFSFLSPAGDPDSADWPSGTYRCQLDCSAAGANCLYGLTSLGTYFARWDGSTPTEFVPQTEPKFSGTGLKLATVTHDWAAGSAADQFVGIVMAENTASMHGGVAESVTLDVGTSDSFMDGPWPSLVDPGATGAAVLSGFGSVSVSVLRARTGSVAPTASGALAARAERARLTALALSGSGGLAPAGVRGRSAVVALDAGGGLVVFAERGREARASLDGDGLAAFRATRDRSVASGLSGVGGMTAAAERELLSALALAGAGSLTASGTVSAVTLVLGAAALAGAGSLSVAAERELVAALGLVGSGALTGRAERGLLARAVLAGEGSLLAAVSRILGSAATFDGVTVLVVRADRSRSASAALVGNGDLSAHGWVARSGAVLLDGAGVLLVSGNAIGVPVGLIEGAGSVAQPGATGGVVFLEFSSAAEGDEPGGSVVFIEPG